MSRSHARVQCCLSDEPRQPKLPLIRLVYNINDEKQQFNAIRLGQEYYGRVANPEDMVLLKLRRKGVKRERGGSFEECDEANGQEVTGRSCFVAGY